MLFLRQYCLKYPCPKIFPLDCIVPGCPRTTAHVWRMWHIFLAEMTLNPVTNGIYDDMSIRMRRGHRYDMDSLAFEKFQNAVFFKIFKFPFNE